MGNKWHMTETNKLSQILIELNIYNNSFGKINQLDCNDKKIWKKRRYNSAENF